MRQAVITIYKSTGIGEYAPDGDDIVFRQPDHDYGIAFTFHFERDRGVFNNDCELVLYNVGSDIVSLFSFDPSTYERRPKIEIRAGETDVTLADSTTTVEILKSSLPLIYSGHVYKFLYNRETVENALSVSMTDMDFSVSVKRAGSAAFNAGSLVLDALKKLISDMQGALGDFSFLEASGFESITFPRDVMFSGQFVMSDILPKLSRQFNFSFHVNETGTIVFTPNVAGAKTTPYTVSSDNGLIGYPQEINWNQYQVQTFFGRPDIFFPMDWMQIESTSLDGGTVYALVLSAQYEWNDTEAVITYKIAPDGEVVETTPVLRF